jgi:AcrR family transcriptional regulator
MSLNKHQESSTRQQIIQSAIELFGEKGFEATTTRDIANLSGANLGSLTYHFENKDGLYSAVIQEIIGLLSPLLYQIEALLSQGKELAGDDPTRQAALVKRMVVQTLQTFLGDPSLRILIPMVIRELSRPSSHFDEFYEAVPRRLHETITDLVSWVEKTEPTERTSIIRAHALIGQIVIFHIGRYILQKRLAVDDLGIDEIELIKQQAADFVLGSLNLPRGDSS